LRKAWSQNSKAHRRIVLILLFVPSTGRY
jgi:hypothetical protein